ncbi:MAG: hypothetical protein GKS00_11370 [Alphaproteobacteria bacterium]|nr:hypothetical protein [Alphaproteobacteria bacterium]NKC02283.1 hypothetical protein [Pseudomonadales bacterium]
MTGNITINVAEGTSDLDQTFNENAGDPIGTPDAGANVGATAQAEIQTIQEAEQALAQHDDRWRRLSDRLANRPQAAPSLEVDGGSQRSVTREYTAYRREWDAQREAIEIGAIRDTIDIRANGTTLTNEFSANAEQAGPEPSLAECPSPTDQDNMPNNDGESRFQRAFSATAPEFTRSNGR